MFAMPVIFEPTDRRIRIRRQDQLVADSGRAMMLIEPGGHPAYYLPLADFVAARLQPSPRIEVSASLGPKRFWSLKLDGGLAEDVAWSYPEALAGGVSMAGYLTVDWKAARWFEEDEEIFRHPRNPYARVDAIRSSRHVQVVLGGQVIADSRRAVFLFETGLVTRYYLPRDDVRGALLRDSALTTYCPYKGEARYHSLELAGRLYEDIAWFYPEPLDECARIKGLVAFYNEKLDRILVDGQAAAPRFPSRI